MAWNSWGPGAKYMYRRLKMNKSLVTTSPAMMSDDGDVVETISWFRRQPAIAELALVLEMYDLQMEAYVRNHYRGDRPSNASAKRGLEQVRRIKRRELWEPWMFSDVT